MNLMKIDSNLWELARDRKMRMPSIITGGVSSGRHGMVKRLVMVNTAIFGVMYLASSGPMRLMYKKHMTL